MRIHVCIRGGGWDSEKPQSHFIPNIAPAAASRVRGDFSNDLHYIIPPISLQMCEFV